jgi:hypothetical protein
MSRRAVSVIASATLVAAALFAPAPARSAEPEAPITVKAGYGEADATWHVGAGAGQYTAKSPDQSNILEGGDVDPHQHSLVQKDSYGVQSRLSYRAIVVEDGEGDQVAFVKSDSYLAQDYLARRVGQILAAEGSSVSYDEIFHMASHNHSSPYYMSPSWGVWIFQDVFDMRAFEYHARQMAAAILAAEQNLVPARMGATQVEHGIFKGMIQRDGIADDGTPRGYPKDFGDLGLAVIRFDSLEDPAEPKPLATLINWGQHPEGLDDHDLITGDFVASLERFVQRATGAPLVFGQGDVGSAEAGPGRPELVPAGIPKKWSHAGHAQAERGGFLLAQDVIRGWEQVGAGTPDSDFPERFVEYSSVFDVEAGNAFVPGPLSHPYPSASNCRTEPTAEGNPGVPLVEPGPPPEPAAPDCGRAGASDDHGSMMWESLKDHGIPVPEHYDVPAFTGVEENLRLKLQAFKMGEVLLASCACEAQVDLILNLESRADEAQDNMWLGYKWWEKLDCTQLEDSSWSCRGLNGQGTLEPIPDASFQRMKAHVLNDARGWDSPEYVPFANSEPRNPADIKGNFTHEELPTDLGYKLPIGVGHAGDYNGYTVSYREYMSWDDYRKALTSYGPHTADYMVTRLVRLAGELNGGPELAPEPHDAFGQADEARQLAASTALGAAAGAEYDAWRAALPNDAGPAEALRQPADDITRFQASTFQWRGGSNAVDNPTVRVERMVDGKWQTFADQSGEVQTKLQFPQGANAFFDTYSGGQEWIWTANFEAFDAFPREIGSTPSGTYRFVVDGLIRQDGADTPYELTSETFDVRPWDGIAVTDLRADGQGISFKVPDYTYPETYTSEFSYIGKNMDEAGGVPFCETCSFRPWAKTGEIAKATVTIERKSGATQQVAASRQSDGSWRAPATLFTGDVAYVDRGGVVDNYGEINGQRSAVIDGTNRRATVLTLKLEQAWSGPTLRVKLIDETGAPVAGRSIAYFADGVRIRSNTTNQNGVTSLRVPSAYTSAQHYEARFAGDADYGPSNASVQNS